MNESVISNCMQVAPQIIGLMYVHGGLGGTCLKVNELVCSECPIDAQVEAAVKQQVCTASCTTSKRCQCLSNCDEMAPANMLHGVGLAHAAGGTVRQACSFFCAL